MKKIFLITAIAVLCSSCGKEKSISNAEDFDMAEVENTSSQENEESTQEDMEISNEDELEDGTYPANIDYYNPNTGQSSTYTLDVKVRNGRLVEIEWENGGWLDESHFTAPNISDGTASFTDDEGREFTVTIAK
ncbi:hypothetical protein [Elizabethkingia sp. M8]|uniref:hypothetical protein n=1 Tax=Elizabethkingia sp. M8 TaxID=2796140 RepID=UPI0019041D00|nr:hypothetical protein [Elizabethkingia sp. M8]QQM25639.1 hypothetical protein JCR23_12140 [Elizabethkingia sp. M8]